MPAGASPVVTVLLATTNRDKVREIRALLAGEPIGLLSLADVPPVDEPDETGATFEENARLKALHYDTRLRSHAAALARSLGGDPDRDAVLVTVAEDSGLEVDALGGEPGVRSARFVRPDATYPERFAEIFRRLGAVPGAPRTARFVCALAAVVDGRTVFETRGQVEGEIAARDAGTGGFGYDPIFRYPPYGATFGEVSEELKRRVAHRTQAFGSLVRWLHARDFRS